MEPSSCLSLFLLLPLLIFTNAFFSSVIRIESIRVLKDHNIHQSRNISVSPPSPPPRAPPIGMSQDLYTNQSIRNTSVSPPPSSLYSTPIPQTPFPTHPPSPVPALFVIDNSSVDYQSNNPVATPLPYWHEFETHKPTGRFLSGRFPVDDHEFHVDPSYLGPSEASKDITQQLNYASVLKDFLHEKLSQVEEAIKSLLSEINRDFPNIYILCTLAFYTAIMVMIFTWCWVGQYDLTYVQPLDDAVDSFLSEDSESDGEDRNSGVNSENIILHRSRSERRLATLADINLLAERLAKLRLEDSVG